MQRSTFSHKMGHLNVRICILASYIKLFWPLAWGDNFVFSFTTVFGAAPYPAAKLQI